MEELNVEEAHQVFDAPHQASDAPNSVNLLESSTYQVFDAPHQACDIANSIDLLERSAHQVYDAPHQASDDPNFVDLTKISAHQVSDAPHQASDAPNSIDLSESSAHQVSDQVFDAPHQASDQVFDAPHQAFDIANSVVLLERSAHQVSDDPNSVDLSKILKHQVSDAPHQASHAPNSADLSESSAHHVFYALPQVFGDPSSVDLSECLVHQVSVAPHQAYDDPNSVDLLESSVHQVSDAPNSVYLSKSSAHLKPLMSFGISQNNPVGHARHLSEDLSSLTLNDLHVNNNKRSSRHQFEANRHTRNFSVDISSLAINESHANKVEEHCHHQLQEKVISRHNSEERNIFKAAEIAERFIEALDKKVLVETVAPIESVKDAVSKFGGILDWKERRKHVQLALDKVREDVPEYQTRLEAAEVDKSKVIEELCSTRRIIEGLKLNLEKAQVEAMQAQQDSELAEIRFKEMQQGIVRKESTAEKAEIELAKERHATALSNLRFVKDELEQLRKEHASLITHKEDAETKAHESTTTSQEIEKTVEDLTLQLISLKESLTSSHATHIIAEEQRRNVALEYQQEKDNWQNELKKVDEEIRILNDEVSASKDLEFKIAEAFTLLANLRGDLTAYEEGTLPHVASVRMTLANTLKELEGMWTNIGKAKNEVKGLWNTAATLRADLEKENGDLEALREKEHHASMHALSLKENLSKMTYEITLVHERINKAKMPQVLQQATKEVNRANANAQLACDEVAKAREEAERAKAEVNVAQLRLEAASREILAVKASKEIAMASSNTLQEYNHEAAMLEPQDGRNSNDYVTLPLQEFDMLSKRACEAEDHAKKQIDKTIEKIEEAKKTEVMTLDKLYQLTKQIDDRRTALRTVQEKAIAAQDKKFIMENELRKRGAKHEQEPTGGDTTLANACNLKNPSCCFDATESSSSNPHIHEAHLPRSDTMETPAPAESKARKSFFPRSIVTIFMCTKKAPSK